MISYTELKKGMIILWNNEAYEVVDIAFVRMQQRKAVVQSKIKQLKTGKVVDKTWQASDNIEEPDFEKKDILFLYTNKGEYWFQIPGDPKSRFMVSEDVIGSAAKYLKPNTTVNAFMLEGNPIKINLPVKMDFEVTEAPPALKGNTAQGGDKSATIETGAKVTVPLFINEGDIIRINTETGSYYERVEKSK
ncbi:MAG: elongation factor P [Candidatus Colwellbacteria bacterium]|nr:elongation factor P [Candidatus Colwellbacteria bacterium]